MSDHFVRVSLASMAAGFVLQAPYAHAESFEVIGYTPRGWTVQNSEDRRVYVRPDGIGAITFHASRPDASSAPHAFAAMWRTYIEPSLPGPAPAPQIQHDGDFEAAIGARQTRAQDTTVTTTATGRTRSWLRSQGGRPRRLHARRPQTAELKQCLAALHCRTAALASARSAASIAAKKASRRAARSPPFG